MLDCLILPCMVNCAKTVFLLCLCSFRFFFVDSLDCVMMFPGLLVCCFAAPPGISTSPPEENMRYFNVMILGQSESPYEGEESFPLYVLLCCVLKFKIVITSHIWYMFWYYLNWLLEMADGVQIS